MPVVVDEDHAVDRPTHAEILADQPVARAVRCALDSCARGAADAPSPRCPPHVAGPARVSVVESAVERADLHFKRVVGWALVRRCAHAASSSHRADTCERSVVRASQGGGQRERGGHLGGQGTEDLCGLRSTTRCLCQRGLRSDQKGCSERSECVSNGMQYTACQA